MDKAPTAIVDNVNAIVASEEELTARRTNAERPGDTIGGFVGTLRFVMLQLAAVCTWVVVNAGLLPFDPYPYSLGGALLSLEGVVLAAFVLMRQAHEGTLSARRSHLNLQANLLVEQEVTKLIQMLQRHSTATGTHADVIDDESEAMAHGTVIGALTQELDQRMGASDAGRARKS